MNKKFQYREATYEDFSIVCTFPKNEQELFFMYPKGVFPLTPEQMAAALKERWIPTVVVDQENNHKVVAYANVYGLDNEMCCLGNVIVDPCYRGQGVSTFLVKAMITIAREKLRVKKVNLICHNTNVNALMFYTKLGFKPTEIVKVVGRNVVGIKMEILTSVYH